jgi:hypothetical protein
VRVGVVRVDWWVQATAAQEASLHGVVLLLGMEVEELLGQAAEPEELLQVEVLIRQEGLERHRLAAVLQVADREEDLVSMEMLREGEVGRMGEHMVVEAVDTRQEHTAQGSSLPVRILRLLSGRAVLQEPEHLQVPARQAESISPGIDHVYDTNSIKKCTSQYCRNDHCSDRFRCFDGICMDLSYADTAQW